VTLTGTQVPSPAPAPPPGGTLVAAPSAGPPPPAQEPSPWPDETYRGWASL
jgi:hypothetical protein